MMANPILNRCLVFVLLCAALSPLHAQEVGEAVLIQGEIAEDVYAAGGTVDVLATVEGDVVVAGGRVTVGERVSGDVMAAGGAVSVHASVGDDVRLAGGDIRLSGSVGDDAIAVGGNVTLTPDGSVNGRAWFSGGRVDLVYRSPQEADIASGAQIRGTISYEPVEWPIAAFVAALAGVGIVVLLSLIVTGSALFLMFPRFIGTAVTTIRAEPWKCLGLGLAVFAATPVVISVLFFTVIGWLPAIVVGALYLVLLLAGFLTGAFYVGDLGWRLWGRGEVSRAGRLWSFVVALIVLTLLGLVPLLGALVLFALTLVGVGVLKLGLYRAYVGQSGN